jgi:hypothetical protein
MAASERGKVCRSLSLSSSNSEYRFRIRNVTPCLSCVSSLIRSTRDNAYTKSLYCDIPYHECANASSAAIDNYVVVDMYPLCPAHLILTVDTVSVILECNCPRLYGLYRYVWYWAAVRLNPVWWRCYSLFFPAHGRPRGYGWSCIVWFGYSSRAAVIAAVAIIFGWHRLHPLTGYWFQSYDVRREESGSELACGVQEGDLPSSDDRASLSMLFRGAEGCRRQGCRCNFFDQWALIGLMRLKNHGRHSCPKSALWRFAACRDDWSTPHVGKLEFNSRTGLR